MIFSEKIIPTMSIILCVLLTLQICILSRQWDNNVGHNKPQNISAIKNEETFSSLSLKLYMGQFGSSQTIYENLMQKYLSPPPELNAFKYNFTGYTRVSQSDLNSTNFNPSSGQVQALDGILRALSPGFFLDCGANDGIFISNTLWLERKLGWTGLLVEADPNAFAVLKSIRRNAWLSNTCFSLTQTPQLLSFFVNPKYSEASGLIPSIFYGATEKVKVQCLPLYTLLLAINQTTIDFFSLDVEGNELEILKTIPFDRITFKVLSIEHLFIPGGKKALRAFMESKGYVFYRTVVNKHSGDSIFLHSSVPLTKEQRELIGHEDHDKGVMERTWKN